jgi:hypothetical protein
MSAAIAIDLSEDDSTPILSAETLAWLDEEEETELQKLARLGAPVALIFAHQCVSNDAGWCTACLRYQAAGGAL